MVEPISEDLFTGVYQYTSIQDGFFGPTFREEGVVNITNGHSNNVRTFEVSVTPTIIVDIEFSIACDAAIMTRYQKRGFGCTMDMSDQVLLGPDTIATTADPNDDTVFELHILEAFEGFDAFCDYSNVPSKVRFSKQ